MVSWREDKWLKKQLGKEGDVPRICPVGQHSMLPPDGRGWVVSAGWITCLKCHERFPVVRAASLIILMVVGLLTGTAYSDNSDYFRRIEEGKKLVASELEYRRALKIEEKKVEVLAALERASAPRVSVRQVNTTKQTSRLTNEVA